MLQCMILKPLTTAVGVNVQKPKFYNRMLLVFPARKGKLTSTAPFLTTASCNRSKTNAL